MIIPKDPDRICPGSIDFLIEISHALEILESMAFLISSG